MNAKTTAVKIEKHQSGYYGVKMSDGSWMKCLDGSDWYSTKKIANEVLQNSIKNEILNTAQEITNGLSGDYKFYAQRKIDAARNAGTLEAARKAGSDIVMMAEK